MNKCLLGLGLFIIVSFLDLGRGFSSAEAYDFGSAQKAFQKKDYETVIQLLSPEVEKLNREALLILGKAYSSLAKHEAAVKAYTAILALNPKDYETKTLIGKEQLSAGKDKEALSNFKDALEINSKYLPTYKALADYYEKKKNKYELRLLYEDIVSRFGEKSDAISKLCELSISDRLYDIGTKYCMRGIQLAPSVADNYVYLGISAKDTGKTKKAEEYLKKAADNFPKSELAQMTFAQFLDEKKNYISSFVYYKRAMAAAPDSLPAILGYGNASLEIQKFPESLEAYEKACRLDKRKTMPFLRRATNSLRIMKMADWLKKFEDSIDKCSG